MPPSLVRLLSIWCCFHGAATFVWSDGPADNRADQVRPIPPPGIQVAESDLEDLQKKCEWVRNRWQSLKNSVPEEDSTTRTHLHSMQSEILVFPRAVELAIEFGQFYKPNEIPLASRLLDEAEQRIAKVAGGGDWLDIVGWQDSGKAQLIVGGFPSEIDGSVQPYGLVVPAGLKRDNVVGGNSRDNRLDVWFHGRGEKLSEVSFLGKQSGDMESYRPGNAPMPERAIILHPYGRYSNAFKFAGEIDALEAIEYVSQRCAVDPNRVAIRGFSMGGAGCWQFATHYADRFFVATPGAGFSETPQFLKSFQGEDVQATAPAYQKTLWQLYDCPLWAKNLQHCPTIAYSGEVDRQKQAADVMVEALAEHEIDLVHLIGPQTEHRIHPDAKLELERRIVSIDRNLEPGIPSKVHFTTPTLRYHRMHWLDLRGLKRHWQPATIDAEISNDSVIQVTTNNITRLRFHFDAGEWPGKASGPTQVDIDGQSLLGPRIKSDRSWLWELELGEDGWQEATNQNRIAKQPGIQGPIDDAFMSSFVFVLPSGPAMSPSTASWVKSEAEHAMRHWRIHFRGDVRIMFDHEVDSATIDNHNLILFGDPTSNQLMAKLLPEIPLRWTEGEIAIGEHSVNATGHVPILVYPNPENPSRYIVINSGFTFREYDYLNNARQTPKLPDWALVDVSNGPTSRDPGIIRAAGFFDESWQPKSQK